MTREEAFRILSLSEDANIYEIENRYSILARANLRNNSQNSESEMMLINEAYSLLTGKIFKVDEVTNPKDDKIILGKKRKYWKNLIYYNFKPALAIVCVIVLVFSIIYTAINNKEADFDLAYLGSFAKLDEKDENFDIEKYLKNKYQLQKVILNLMPIYEGVDLQSQNAIMMKMSIITAGVQNVDLMVLDKNNFDVYAPRGIFSNLNDYYAKLGESSSNRTEAVYSRRTELPLDADIDDEAIPVEDEQIYGIKVDSEHSSGLGIYGQDFIFTIPTLAKHKELSYKILTDIINDNELTDKFIKKLNEIKVQQSIEQEEFSRREAEREKKRAEKR